MTAVALPATTDDFSEILNPRGASVQSRTERRKHVTVPSGLYPFVQLLFLYYAVYSGGVLAKDPPALRSATQNPHPFSSDALATGFLLHQWL